MSVGAQPATSFVIDFDLAGLLAGLGVECGSPEDPDAWPDDEQAAATDCPTTFLDVPGRGANLIPAGPALAAWLTSVVPDQCADADLPDIAYAYHRLAAWAQSRELRAVAEIATRTAARRGRSVDDTQLLPEAAAQVALTLAMSQPTALDWTSLGIRLCDQLTGTGAALADGEIDLSRARLIAEATAALSDEAARAVEDRVLSAAGDQTTAQLRASLRRAVIAADPDGADKRRERAERHAKVGLYPDAEGTATLTGTGLPTVSAAAAMARITAMARAMKSAGHAGGLDYLRAYVMLGLLLGTLPLIPPAPGAPAEEPPDDFPDAAGPDDPDADDSGSGDPGPNDAGPNDSGAPASPADTGNTALPDESAAADSSAPASPADTGNRGAPNDASNAGQPDPAPLPVEPPDLNDRAPPEPDLDTSCREEDEPVAADGAPVSWPPLPAGLPSPWSGKAYDKAPGRPPPGLLDVLVPWSALTLASAEPAVLGRIGPVTPRQASQLLDLAMHHPGTQWRVTLTDGDGHAQAVERLHASRSTPLSSTPAWPVTTSPVIGRFTVTIPEDVIRAGPGNQSNQSGQGNQTGQRNQIDRVGHEGLARALLRAAKRAAASADAARVANQAVGGCAHLGGGTSYRPPARLREFVAARDLTCTFPPCGQPAWKADLDHTVPWHKGGPTCACNLGGRCRTHHKIKQLPGWKLEQTDGGTFRWTTPAGRTHTVEPNRYPR
jgi:hypothetical protein